MCPPMRIKGDLDRSSHIGLARSSQLGEVPLLILHPPCDGEVSTHEGLPLQRVVNRSTSSDEPPGNFLMPIAGL